MSPRYRSVGQAFARKRDGSVHTQKPSSARLTQLTANIEPTIAAADASVAMALTDRMTKTLNSQRFNTVRQSAPNHGEIGARQIMQLTVATVLHRGMPARKNPHFFRVMGESVGEFLRMYRLLDGGIERWLVAFVVLASLALASWWLDSGGTSPQSARDFEECVEQVQTDAMTSSTDERGRLTMDCNARFAGRRKPGGGYTYYDFMQNRNFDIAGPNPTAEERKQIDGEYMNFLDAQRREEMSAELARRQNEQLQANIESARQPVGPPMILLPRKRPIDRSKPARCEDASLSCSWAKFSAVVKNAFASSPRKKP
jgi:hypothetical protein